MMGLCKVSRVCAIHIHTPLERRCKTRCPWDHNSFGVSILQDLCFRLLVNGFQDLVPVSRFPILQSVRLHIYVPSHITEISLNVTFSNQYTDIPMLQVKLRNFLKIFEVEMSPTCGVQHSMHIEAKKKRLKRTLKWKPFTEIIVCA